MCWCCVDGLLCCCCVVELVGVVVVCLWCSCVVLMFGLVCRVEDLLLCVVVE